MSESTTQKTDNGGIAGVDAILGGWLAGTFGFRSVFIVMAVIAALAVVFVVLAVRESTAEDTPKMDWAGAITLGIAFLAAYLAINEIEKLAGANWILVVVLIVIAAVFFVVFWRHEGSAAAPMVSTHYMKQRRTWGLLVTTLLDLAFGPVAGVLASKFGYHVVLRAGLVVTIVGALFGIFVANNPSIAALVVISVVLGISYAGTANIMLNGLGIVLSPKDNPGYLPGMNAGALVAARANGTAAQDAMRLATRASALAITRVGAQQSIPTLAEANSLE
ncbi:MAG: MFS transporter [Coriobacteriaceae bacterium]|nr:MFS transporter [Coriobacteriaceae bacterium]